MIATRFAVSLHILTLVARGPTEQSTSARLAWSIGTNPVVVRRLSGLLARAGLITVQRGPGGASLRRGSRSIVRGVAPGPTAAQVVAGVLLGFTVPVLRSQAAGGPEAGPGLAEHLEHLVRPLSAGVAVPVFAFFASGVVVGGWSGLVASLSDPVALGIVAGLVVGKPVGILGTTYVVSRLTRADLDPDLRWLDVLGVAVLAGIGFTVSLLIGELAYGQGSGRDDHVKVAVLTGSVLAALLASVLLRTRDAAYRRIAEADRVDADGDGVPDSYQRD